MSTDQTHSQLQDVATFDKVVNDFSIAVGTMNGSGSQTSNLTLLRAFFKMGIPVSGKNLFPSNIQGLPTWYTIRVNKDGYLARSETLEIVIAMNPPSFAQDLASLDPGGAFFYADHIKQAITRDDVFAYPMPVKKLARESDAPRNLRDYVANMVYVGVLAQILGIDVEKIRGALEFHFKSKQKPIELNFNVVQAACAWAQENLEKRDPFQAAKMDETSNCIMSTGNTAGALGSIYGGVQFVSWYPITPASSLAEAASQYLPSLRKDPETGKNTFAVVQAEDELAAIGMAVGAGWGGLRALTSTSGPGISLMGEYASLAYFTEVPVVAWNVARMGPSTGLPTRTSQGDVNLTYYLGQGDIEHIVLLPGSVKECFEFGWRSFDIAERYQTPVFVLSDLDLGMNHWMSEPFEYPDEPIDRGKILWEDELDAIEDYGRYLDVDGDGIGYRTLPGNRHPRSAYFTRGTGHDEHANYSEEPDVWVRNLDRIKRKIDGAIPSLPKAQVRLEDGAEIGLIAFGSTNPAVEEAQLYLRQAGLRVDYLRLRALPIGEEVKDFIQSHKRTYVIEMNRDGQLHQILLTEVPSKAIDLISLTHNDGLPLVANWIKGEILNQEQS